MLTRRRFLLIGSTLLAVGLSACTGTLNAVTSRSGYSVEQGIQYAGGPRGSFDLYVPDTAGPGTPVVVFFYGGGWSEGSRGNYLFVGQSLASAGVIVAIPDYRLYPEVRFPSFMEDAAAAVSAISRAMRGGAYGVPAGTHPIVLMGHSAGAHVASLLATDNRYLRAAGTSKRSLAGFVGLAGPYDFLPLTDEKYRRIFPEALREQSQPVNFVDGSEPPMLLITGTADSTVDPQNTRSLAAAVRRRGGSAETEFYEGVGHVGVVAALSTVLNGEGGIRARVLQFIGRRG